VARATAISDHGWQSSFSSSAPRRVATDCGGCFHFAANAQSINPSRHRLLVAIDRYCWMHVLGVLEQYRVSLASAKFSQIQSQREFKTGLRPDRILFFHV